MSDALGEILEAFRKQCVTKVNNGNGFEVTKAALQAYMYQKQAEALQEHSDQWRVWQDDAKNVRLIDVITWYDVRIAELRAAAKARYGGKDGDAI